MITPVYNLEPYVAECIESVLSQTFRNFELLIVDDGSTDRSAEIIAAWAAKDHRIRAFRGPNRGVSHARNVAMRHARGRYFTLLDGDDRWGPTFAEKMVAALEREPDIGVMVGNALNLGGPLDGRPARPWPADPEEIRFADMIEHEDAVFIMSVFRREVFERIGGFNEALFRSEDYEFWMRAAAAGFRFRTAPEPLASYRRRPDGASADPMPMFESIMKVLASARGFRARARADELGAIDRKLERLTTASMLTQGKTALLRRRFAEARSHFWELYRRGSGFPFAGIALGLRVAPSLVLHAYTARLRALEARNSRVSEQGPAIADAAVRSGRQPT